MNIDRKWASCEFNNKREALPPIHNGCSTNCLIALNGGIYEKSS